MLHIGCHLSSSKGFESMGETAVSIGADTFQYFTRNPRGSRAKPIDMEDIKRLRNIISENKFPCILGHASYTMNPCSSKENLRIFAADIMKEDLIRMENIPGQYYNFHPGSHTKQGIEKGIEQIIMCLNKVITEEQTTTILIETMPGKGTEVGSCFEEIAAIINGVEHKEKLGVCFDTCHVHDAGYDIVNNLQGVIDEFDETIGLDYLRAVHLNDSKNICGSHKDRHERIGHGEIGLNAITEIITHPIFKDIPFYLETPNDLKGYQDEIKLLKKQYCNIYKNR